jgi:hypothetical protein
MLIIRALRELVIFSGVVQMCILRDGSFTAPSYITLKEDIKEQPTSRNLSATATRVL